MIGWIKYLVYIMSFFMPPVGVITFWVSLGRGDDLEEIARMSFLAAFAGVVVWCIIAAVSGRMFWSGMGRW